MRSRSAARRSHGSSCRKRSATSKVAPPQHSTESICGSACAWCGATRSRSNVRRRVANSDWWASRKVVSVTCRAVSSRSQRAKPAGPSSCRRWRGPSGGAPRGGGPGSLPAGSGPAGALPCGRLTVTSASRSSSREARSPRALRASELRAVVDERRVGPPRAEVRVVQHRAQEPLVGLHAAHAHLLHRPPRPRDGGGEVVPAGGDLEQERVEVGRDLRPDVGRALVEPDARAARGAVGGDAPRVRPEGGRGVLRGDPALQRRAARADAVLGEAELGERRPAADQELRAHEVDVRDLLGDRVLDLDARVHLDEHVLARGRVDEELHRAGVHVADGLGEAHGVGAQAVADRRVEVRGRRELDHLLVAPLDGAVALEQMDDVPLAVGQDLHLDVPRADDRLLQVDGRRRRRRPRPPSWRSRPRPAARRPRARGACRARRRPAPP